MGLLDDFAVRMGFTPSQLKQFDVCEGFGEIEIYYHLADGTRAPRYQLRSDDGFTWNAASNQGEIVPYGLDRPVPYDKGRLIITEGASDCWALWSTKIPALGIPGATMVGKLLPEHIAGATEIGVVQEPDDAGQRFPHRVANKLWQSGFTGSIRALDFTPYKDPRDAYKARPAAFRAFLDGVWKKGTLIAQPRNGDAPRGAIVVAEEFMAHTESVTWLIDGLLPVHGSMIIGSKIKVGKSSLALYLARQVARGASFLNRATQGGRVLYLSLDEPATITRSRMATLGFATEALDIFADRGGPPREWVPWLRDIVAAKPYALVVVDTLIKLLGVKEIRDYGEWNEKLKPLHMLAQEFGFSWVGTAHNKKDSLGGGEAVAGSTAIGAAFDTLLILQKVLGRARTLESIQRYGNDIEATMLQLHEDGTLTLGDEQWLARRKAVANGVLFLMADGVERTATQIGKQSHQNLGDVYDVVTELCAEGLLVQTTRHHYRLAPEAFDSQMSALFQKLPESPRDSRNRPKSPEQKSNPAVSEPSELSEDTEAPEVSEVSEVCAFFTGYADAQTCARCGHRRAEHDQ